MFCQGCGTFDGALRFTGEGIPACKVRGCGVKRWGTSPPKDIEVVQVADPEEPSIPWDLSLADRILLIGGGIRPE